jgi:hypothetical protein
MQKQISRNQTLSKRAIERLLEDAIEYFHELPGFSFALTGGGISGIGPTLASAVELVCLAYSGDEYDGPIPESMFRTARAEAVGRHDDIVAAVTARVQQLHDAGASFVVCWHAVGELMPRVDFSADYEGDEGRSELAEVLWGEIGEQIML